MLAADSHLRQPWALRGQFSGAIDTCSGRRTRCPSSGPGCELLGHTLLIKRHLGPQARWPAVDADYLSFAASFQTPDLGLQVAIGQPFGQETEHLT